MQELAIYLYDSANDIILQKPLCPQQLQSPFVSNQAIIYNEGFIYFLGGLDCQTNKIVKSCLRYNIITEKWQLLRPMLFEISEGAACSINEYQIVVAGGVNNQGKCSDILQMYDIREN